MNVDRPHEIKSFKEIPTVRQEDKMVFDRAWLPLTEREARLLETMNESEKNAWFNKLGLSEKLRRYSEAERILDEMEKNNGQA